MFVEIALIVLVLAAATAVLSSGMLIVYQQKNVMGFQPTTLATKTSYGIFLDSNVHNFGNVDIRVLETKFYGKNVSYNFTRSGYIRVDGLNVNTTAGAYNTVAFLMYWDGTNCVMPMGWASSYDLWFNVGYFGFNTGESNIIGIPSSYLRGSWHFVVAVFYNGVPSPSTVSLYIDGVKQPIYQCLGSTTASRSVTTSVGIGRWLVSSNYLFSGYIKVFMVYNRGLSSDEVLQLTKAVLYRSAPIVYNGLVLWLDESTITGSLWYDRSQYKRDGVVYGVQVCTLKDPFATRYFSSQPMVKVGDYGCSPWLTAPNFPDAEADWIWRTAGAASNAPVEEYWVWRKFLLPSSDTLTVKITADDYFKLYVDGVMVGEGGNWQQTYTFTLNLAAGEHVMKILVGNSGGSAGMICSVSNSGNVILFHSSEDGTWLVYNFIPSSSSKKLDFDLYNVMWFNPGDDMVIEWTAFGDTSPVNSVEEVRVT
ncbi:MAG: LamG-like jellyroll fold domain-containing protein [Candidatus Bathyarchaeia archaeon]